MIFVVLDDAKNIQEISIYIIIDQKLSVKLLRSALHPNLPAGLLKFVLLRPFKKMSPQKSGRIIKRSLQQRFQVKMVNLTSRQKRLKNFSQTMLTSKQTEPKRRTLKKLRWSNRKRTKNLWRSLPRKKRETQTWNWLLKNQKLRQQGQAAKKNQRKVKIRIVIFLSYNNDY